MDDVKTSIFRILSDDLSASELEQWVYADKNLESLLGQDDYLNLISLDYRSTGSIYEAKKILEECIDISEYEAWRVSKILKAIVNRSPDVHMYIEQCYDLYCHGYGFLDNLGLGYGLSVACPPTEYSTDYWDQLSASEQLELINELYPGVANEAEKVLNWLSMGKIKLQGRDHLGHIIYLDHRSDEEKAPTAYKITVVKED